MTPEALIEAAAKQAGTSEAQIAKQLVISRQALSRIKKGYDKMPDHVAVRLASIAGLDQIKVLAENLEDRAPISMKPYYSELTNRAGKAAGIMLAIALSYQILADVSGYAMYIM